MERREERGECTLGVDQDRGAACSLHLYCDNYVGRLQQTSPDPPFSGPGYLQNADKLERVPQNCIVIVSDEKKIIFMTRPGVQQCQAQGLVFCP